ncbi:hypothetical protein [Zooshikella sp. RANM57]|uniref:hypothetical protein n=1 Tax=Zooshikella sp. RANM57 TaxID=3425863 RepID=UPI003D6F26D8
MKNSITPEILISAYKNACGKHCEATIGFEQIENYPRDWNDKELKAFVNSIMRKYSCIEVDWNIISFQEMLSQFLYLLTKPLINEYPPFGKSSEEDVNQFINDLLNFVGEGYYFSSLLEFSSDTISDMQVFEDNDNGDFCDICLIWLGSEWLAFIAHRGFD